MSKQVKLTRRRVLGILITIGLASAAVGAGTLAVFSDTEQSTDNTIEAGSLDLTIDGADQEVQLLNVSGAVPGDSDSSVTELYNNGSVDGKLNVTLSGMNSSENSRLDPEVEAGDESPDSGELDEHIFVKVGIEGDSTYNKTLAQWEEDPEIASNVGLEAGASRNVTVAYEIPEGAGNVIQTDSVTADFEFTLTS